MEHPRRSLPLMLLAAAAAVLAAACRALDPTYTEPALIILRGDTATITVPDSVNRSIAFQVSVETFGGGCTRQIARTDEKVTGSLVEIRPFNETTKVDGRQLCPSDVIPLTHSITAEVKQAGPATIRVIAESRDLAGRVQPAQIQRVITVR